MVHQRESLAFGLEPANHLARIHPQLDHLQGDAPFHRLFLLRHVHHTAAALANFLKDFVAINQLAFFFPGE